MSHPFERRVPCTTPVSVTWPPKDTPPDIHVHYLTVEPNDSNSVVLSIGDNRVVVNVTSLTNAMGEMLDLYAGRRPQYPLAK